VFASLAIRFVLTCAALTVALCPGSTTAAQLAFSFSQMQQPAQPCCTRGISNDDQAIAKTGALVAANQAAISEVSHKLLNDVQNLPFDLVAVLEAPTPDAPDPLGMTQAIREYGDNGLDAASAFRNQDYMEAMQKSAQGAIAMMERVPEYGSWAKIGHTSEEFIVDMFQLGSLVYQQQKVIALQDELQDDRTDLVRVQSALPDPNTAHVDLRFDNGQPSIKDALGVPDRDAARKTIAYDALQSLDEYPALWSTDPPIGPVTFVQIREGLRIIDGPDFILDWGSNTDPNALAPNACVASTCGEAKAFQHFNAESPDIAQQIIDERSSWVALNNYTQVVVANRRANPVVVSPVPGAGPDIIQRPEPVQAQTYQTPNGPRTIDQMTAELKAAGYSGPWDSDSIVAAYQKTSASANSAPAPTVNTSATSGVGTSGSGCTALAAAFSAAKLRADPLVAQWAKLSDALLKAKTADEFERINAEVDQAANAKNAAVSDQRAAYFKYYLNGCDKISGDLVF